MIAENEELPPMMHKEFKVNIVFGPDYKIKPMAISSLRSDLIGHLVVIKAIVVRTSEVRPEASLATYTCDVCGS